MLATKLLSLLSVSVFAPARRHDALLPETTPFDWSPSSGASLAMLDRAIVELGSTENAAPLLENVVHSNTILAIGSSVTGVYGGCTSSIAPWIPACTACGGECGAPAKFRENGWLRRFAAGLDSDLGFAKSVAPPIVPSS